MTRELEDGTVLPCGDVPLTARSGVHPTPGRGTYELAGGRILPDVTLSASSASS